MALSVCSSATDGRSRELVRHGTPPFPVACYRHGAETVNAVPWHWHDELEAVVVKEGRVFVSAEGESRELGPGERHRAGLSAAPAGRSRQPLRLAGGGRPLGTGGAGGRGGGLAGLRGGARRI